MVDFRQRNISDNLNLISQGCVQDKILGGRQKKMRLLLLANAGDVGLIPGSGRSFGGGNGNSLQYSCLGNAMDGKAWQATVRGVAESFTTEHTHEAKKR